MPVEFLTDAQAGAYGRFAGVPACRRGLILNTITLWNTVYLDHALDQLRATGYPVLDADIARLSPYMRRHINFHGPLLLRRHEPRRRAAGATRPRRLRRLTPPPPDAPSGSSRRGIHQRDARASPSL